VTQAMQMFINTTYIFHTLAITSVRNV